MCEAAITAAATACGRFGSARRYPSRFSCAGNSGGARRRSTIRSHSETPPSRGSPSVSAPRPPGSTCRSASMVTRNCPSAPCACRSLPVITSKARLSGTVSVSSSNTVTPRCGASWSAASSATSAGPRIRHRPSDTTSRVRSGEAGSMASAASADILASFGAASALQPARSRRSSSGAGSTPSSSASASKVRASCVQQRTAFPDVNPFAASSICAVQSAWQGGVTSNPVAADSALASIDWVPMQSHVIKVLVMSSFLASGVLAAVSSLG